MRGLPLPAGHSLGQQLRTSLRSLVAQWLPGHSTKKLSGRSHGRGAKRTGACCKDSGGRVARPESLSMWTRIAAGLRECGSAVRTVKMTLDPELVDAVDKAARRLGTTRSAFTRRALREALNQASLRPSDNNHRLAYPTSPARPR